MDIVRIVEQVLEKTDSLNVSDVQQVWQLDAEARRRAQEIITNA